jgi:two-component system, NtrC family, response regulator AtoC
MARARPSSPPDPLNRLVGEAPVLQTLRAQIRHLTRFDAVGPAAVPTVLLQGETGTGKGLVARVIHDSGPRAPGPFIEVNCAAIPETLLEAELFGVEAGAFTDAKHAKPGLFAAVSGGTLFLDEIAALALPLQGKCLTAIETKRVRRVGAVVEHALDVKLIAATQVALSEQVQAGHFRADLYHRLAVVVLELPSLRERGDDILVLARALLQQYGAAYGVGPQRLSQAAEAWLVGQHWTGNVRELSHLLERVALLETAMVIDPESLARLCLSPSVPEASTVSRLTPTPGAPPHEIARLTDALRQSGGNITAAARRLGMSRGGLRHRLHTYGLTRPSRHQTVSPARAGEPPVEPSPQEKEGQGEGGACVEPAMGWVSKPVAMLAIAVTWPDLTETDALCYEPWTVASRWEERIAEMVAGFGGIILQGPPSLCLVAFGLPQTLEQLPQRAVQAALAIRYLAAETHAFTREMPSPAVRLAAHLGTLLVAEATGESPWRWLAMVETLGLPVRLLGHAVAGEILVSSEVGRLVEGWCECQPHAGPPGIETVLVMRPKPRPSPLRLHGERPRSRFVGRERELATLTDLLAQATEGRGQVVGIVGEPGIGKSRLLHEFHQYLRAQSVPYVEGHCLSYRQAIPFGPVLALLRQHCGIMEADAPEAVTAKVRRTLQTVGIAPEEGAPYVFQLLGLQVGSDRLATLSPEVRKTRTFETLRQLYLTSSQQHPLVLVVENLHWIDPTSEVFLTSLIEHLAGARLFVLLTYRPRVPTALDRQVLRHPDGSRPAFGRGQPTGARVCPPDGHYLRPPRAADPHQGAGQSLLPGGNRPDVGGTGRTEARERDDPATRPAAPRDRAGRVGGAHRPPARRRKGAAADVGGDWSRVFAPASHAHRGPARSRGIAALVLPAGHGVALQAAGRSGAYGDLQTYPHAGSGLPLAVT